MTRPPILRALAVTAGLALLLPLAASPPATASSSAGGRAGPADATTPTPRAADARGDVVPSEADASQDEPYAGYLFSYFVGEGTADGEQVYFGLSEGDDPLNYRDLNDGEPVLTSDIGEQGVRDPFIIRSPEGDKFYQIATDLKVHGSWDWDGFQRHGSHSIVVWESTDLVDWSEPRLVEVAPENAGNTWAPEAFYDEELGAYVVFWASKLYADDDPEHTGSQHNRMMYATTTDFVTFSEPEVWIDPGYSVIDSTVLREDGVYYRFTKDERSNTGTSPCGKFITAEKSAELRAADYEFIADCIGKATADSAGIGQGEGPLVFKDNHAERWYMFIDEFGGRGYVPFVTEDLDSGQWRVAEDYTMPSRPRHGTVLPVTQEEYHRLLAAYQPDALVETVEPVEVTTRKQQAPALPAEVPVTFADGTSGTAAVEWEEVPAEAYAKTGTFEVSGTVADALEPATATVHVQAKPIKATSVEIEQERIELWQHGSATLDAAVEPANATAGLRWESSAPGVATVADGVVTAVAPGTAVVTAASGGLRDTVEVTVTEEPPGLAAHFPLDAAGGASAVEGVPDAVLAGGASAGPAGVSLDGVDDHVVLPQDLLAGIEDVTVSLKVRIDPEQRNPYFIYGLGNTRNGAGDGYLFTTGNAYRTSLSLGNWSGEQTVSAGRDLERGVWSTLTYTLAGETATLYLDGVEVGRRTGVTVDPEDIGGGSTAANYLGRSLYAADHHLRGEVRDFRLYERALTAEEVAAL
ncbi:LamG-like jellyroll fold domain-containing protein [Zhihengliuella sp.]|uniref:LamG-like jellyroll fold domain-containing protein n=1 Tax=Zhihengliuella sp. TaxID=1954483 RepID=UPI00281199F6|nr:LamG-like jellyroll fold domain-containing protein [Zhihengliuella sp.]